MADQKVYTIDELARLFSMHRDMIWDLRARGELRGFRSGRRRVFIADEVQAFLRRCSIPADPDEPPAAVYYASWPREPGRVRPVDP